jgi:hypothetical protein
MLGYSKAARQRLKNRLEEKEAFRKRRLAYRKKEKQAKKDADYEKNAPWAKLMRLGKQMIEMAKRMDG